MAVNFNLGGGWRGEKIGYDKKEVSEFEQPKNKVYRIWHWETRRGEDLTLSFPGTATALVNMVK